MLLNRVPPGPAAPESAQVMRQFPPRCCASIPPSGTRKEAWPARSERRTRAPRAPLRDSPGKQIDNRLETGHPHNQ